MMTNTLTHKGNGQRVRGRSVRLRTCLDVQRQLARVYTETRQGTLSEPTCRTLVYALSVAVRVTEAATFESRLSELEKKAGIVKGDG